jgi:hypothetical protein
MSSIPIHDILPPEPPSDEDEIYNSPTFVPGEFEYVKNENIRRMLENAWQAITLTESWDFVKQEIESFSGSTDPIILKIMSKMKELGYDSHSGCSFGVIMREMQIIAQNGEKEYIKRTILSERYKEVY